MLSNKEGMLNYKVFMNHIKQLDEYESAHDLCLHYLEQNGNKGKHALPVKFSDFLENLLTYFSANEDFKKCARVKTLFNRLGDPNANLRCGNTIFFKKVKAILNFEKNCKFYWSAASENGALLFCSRWEFFDSEIKGLPITVLVFNHYNEKGASKWEFFVSEIKALPTAIMVFNHYNEKSDYKKSKFLKALAEKLIEEEKYEEGMPFGTKVGYND